MSYLAATVSREAKNMAALRDVYEKQLAELPKGSIQIKERKDKKYYYLSYRNGGRVASEYLGNDESVVAELKERLERRKGIENLLKNINKELASMNKILEAAK